MKKTVETRHLSTMRIGGKALSLSILRTKSDIERFVERSDKNKTIILGGGSNSIFSDTSLPYIIGLIKIRGVEVRQTNSKSTMIRVGAGENWDKFVKFTVSKNLSGIEALSAIPGTVGASPIQNIGAYGSEVKDTIVLVEAYDTKTKKWVTLKNKDCQFSYRNSIFKKYPKRWVITYVTFKLHPTHNLPRRNKAKGDHINNVKIPNYKDVQNYFAEQGITSPNLKQIRKAIIKIRAHKLPDPKIIPNCGSFFKNPFISKLSAKKLKQKFPTLPLFESEEGTKVPAGFLIDSLGLKGKTISNIVIYKNNALVLTNPNKASFKDLLKAQKYISDSVYKKFGITLEREVNLVE